MCSCSNQRRRPDFHRPARGLDASTVQYPVDEHVAAPGIRQNSPCHLHGSIQPKFSDTSMWSAVRSTICPNNDGGIYTNNCGANYLVECYTDRTGQQVGSGWHPWPSGDFRHSAELCSQTRHCVTFHYRKGYSNQYGSSNDYCYLKSEVGVASADRGIWGAKLLSGCTHEYEYMEYPPGWPEERW